MNRRRALALAGGAGAGVLLAAGVAGCGTPSIPFKVRNGSIILTVTFNGRIAECVLDTGDAIGPVLTVADAERCAVQPAGVAQVAGAGGISEVWTCDVTVGLGSATFTDEAGAIDPDLAMSLLGLPFFLARAKSVSLDFARGELSAEWK